MTSYTLQENMSLGLSINHNTGSLTQAKGLGFSLSFSYTRNQETYPGAINLNYNSRGNTLLYNSQVQLAAINNNAVGLSFNKDTSSFSFSNSVRGFDNSLSYSTSPSGDSVKFGIVAF